MALPYIINKRIIENTRPSMRYGGTDFFAWQSEARAKLAALLGLHNIKKKENVVPIIEYVNELAEYTEYRFTVESEEDYSFPVVMRVPRGKVGKLPLIICLQGHSTGMHISLGQPIFERDATLISGGDRDFCVRAVKEGFIAVAAEQRNFGSCGGAEDGSPQCYISSMSAIINGRTTIGERVHDVSCLIDVLTENFDFIDNEKIMLMGNSGGGTATYYAACIDERISLAMPSCAVCTYKDSIAAMRHCSCNFIPNIASYFDMGDLGGLIAPRTLIVVNGREDEIFPAPGVDESFAEIKRLYTAAGVPERAALVTGDGGHRFYADIAWKKLHDLTGV